MGIEIDREQFDETDYEDFARKLQTGLAAFEELLRRPGFGEGSSSIGLEVEFSLVDANGRPIPINRTVLAETLDPRLAVELDRFNLEYNSAPVELAGHPFATIARELEDAMAKIGDVAAGHGARIALIGILPTLREEDLHSAAMTDSPRYRALSAGLRRLRASSFRIEIEGDESLGFVCDDVTLEGANTSLQVHLRVSPQDFAATYNAAQIATAPVLAACANSPIFLSTLLWRETRVALFGQAVDYRLEGPGWRPSRASFGHGWVHEGATELFAQSVALHSPILPIVGAEDPMQVLAAAGVPDLSELRLHHGTVWSWNRAVFEPSHGGHLRIEMRCLPSGPSLPDMMANAAFLIGLTLGLKEETSWMTRALPFRLAHDSFYRAARDGLDAVLMWPSDGAPSPRPVRAADLIPQLIPIAKSGLVNAGVDASEAEGLLAVVETRVARRLTGASWLRSTLARLEKDMPRHSALTAMFEAYLKNLASGRPLGDWGQAP